jgi:hypothetical protein
MFQRLALTLAWVLGAILSTSGAVEQKAVGPSDDSAVTIDDIAAGIQTHIDKEAQAHGGYYEIEFKGKTLNLQLVRVHLEYLADLGRGVRFACVDLVGNDGPVYDVDFFMKGPPGAMTVTETSVHKVDGHPLYLWEQKRDGTWRRVPVKGAPRRLLGVVKGSDQFEFTYRVKLPEITGQARLWLPLASSDTFQRVTVKEIQLPQPWRQLEDPEHGNKVLFLQAGPADSGKTVEIRYQVRRFEKGEYAVREPRPQQYLKPERLVPTNETFRTIALQVTRGKTNDLARARALYDHVIEKLRYAKYGAGWGRGDALSRATRGRGTVRIFTPTSSRWRGRSQSQLASPSVPLSLPSATRVASMVITVGLSSLPMGNGFPWTLVKRTRIRAWPIITSATTPPIGSS